MSRVTWVDGLVYGRGGERDFRSGSMGCAVGHSPFLKMGAPVSFARNGRGSIAFPTGLRHPGPSPISRNYAIFDSRKPRSPPRPPSAVDKNKTEHWTDGAKILRVSHQHFVDFCEWVVEGGRWSLGLRALWREGARALETEAGHSESDLRLNPLPDLKQLQVIDTGFNPSHIQLRSNDRQHFLDVQYVLFGSTFTEIIHLADNDIFGWSDRYL